MSIVIIKGTNYGYINGIQCAFNSVMLINEPLGNISLTRAVSLNVNTYIDGCYNQPITNYINGETLLPFVSIVALQLYIDLNFSRSGTSNIDILNSTTGDLSDSVLNALYPTARYGQFVKCININWKYEKQDNSPTGQWEGTAFNLNL